MMKKLVRGWVALILFPAGVWGQVQFHCDFNPKTNTLEIQAISEVTYQAPYNRVGTAQVTLRVPDGHDFSYHTMESVGTQARWELTSVLRNPAAAPGYDYYSFGLQTLGTDAYEFVAQKPTPLFRLLGVSADQVSLLSNRDVLVEKAHEIKVNAGNQINILGYRQGLENAYVGNGLEPNPKDTREAYIFITQLFPNPAKGKTKLTWENYDFSPPQSLLVKVAEVATGRTRFSQWLSTQKGRHSLDIPVDEWHSGMYIVTLFRDGLAIGEGSRLYVTD